MALHLSMTMSRSTPLLAVLVLALVLVASVNAGDYRNGRTRPLRDPATLSWNYEPVQTLARHKLPEVKHACRCFDMRRKLLL